MASARSQSRPTASKSSQVDTQIGVPGWGVPTRVPLRVQVRSASSTRPERRWVTEVSTTTVTRGTSHAPRRHWWHQRGLWNRATTRASAARAARALVPAGSVSAVRDTVPAPMTGSMTATGVARPGISWRVTRWGTSRSSSPCQSRSTLWPPMVSDRRERPAHGRVTGAEAAMSSPRLVTR